MLNLDGKKIVNNIYAKAKELDVKIGDIEKEVPVSLGYFSRFLKDDNHSIPSLESLYVAANKLNVTIDFLLLSNYAGMNEEELLMQNKISVLVSKTKNDEYCWNEITERKFYKHIKPVNGVVKSNYSFATFPNNLQHYDAFGNCDYFIQQYYSFFQEKILELYGSIYSLKLDSNEFYISKVVDDSENIKELYFELFVIVPFNDKHKIIKLVNAAPKDKFYDILDELYNTCVFKSQEFKLDTSAIKALASIK
jgi:transcriptional regulator with XRE-family HTH domain